MTAAVASEDRQTNQWALRSAIHPLVRHAGGSSFWGSNAGGFMILKRTALILEYISTLLTALLQHNFERCDRVDPKRTCLFHQVAHIQQSRYVRETTPTVSEIQFVYYNFIFPSMFRSTSLSLIILTGSMSFQWRRLLFSSWTSHRRWAQKKIKKITRLWHFSTKVTCSVFIFCSCQHPSSLKT